MKKSYLTAFLAMSLTMSSCAINDKTSDQVAQLESSTESVTSVEVDNAEYDGSILYSNLVDDETQKIVKESLLASGLMEENVALFLKAVSYYNDAVGDIGLVKEGFEKSEIVQPEYDVEKMLENWDKTNGSFEKITGNRNNCRMTTFLLANNLIEIDGDYVKDNKMLFMDNDTIQYSENPFFTDDNIARFNTFYGDIPTDLVKDINVHLAKVKSYWNEKKVRFIDSDVSVITVWLHSDLDNNLFIGHTGILLPAKDEETLLFIEKISFEEPYQVLKFKNRLALDDYLMRKYDTAYEQETARPFIMENAELLLGHRADSDNE